MLTVNLKHSKANTLKFKPEIEQAKQRFLKEDLGFKKLPYQYGDLLSDFKIADDMLKDKKAIVIIGIGGSDLGTRAIHKALSHPHYNEYADMTLNNEPKLYFMGDTTDPEAISGVMDILNLERTLFIVVSKSGKTIEIISNFIFIRNEFIKNHLDPLKNIIFITDPKNGDLRELSNSLDFKTITHADVGGRFTVLSSVSAIPAHLLGLDVEQMLKGAMDLNESIKSDEFDIVFEYVLNKFAQYKEGKSISVMMPYQYSLYEFAKWYQQLWGESLGKEVDTTGEKVNQGQTPIAVLGPVDQHSQLQLFNEGPNDKFFTFIRAEESRQPLSLPEKYKDVEQFEFLKGKSFQEILNFEQETTAFALSKYGRPHATISMPKVDAYHLGQLFYFFEVAVTLFGFALDINPFDQPGVELSKNAMYGVLGKKGYEDVKSDFEKWKNS